MPVSPGITLQVPRPLRLAAPQASALPERPAAASGPSEDGCWRIEPLQGWHLPLMAAEPFLSLQPLLQRCLLWALPERLLAGLSQRRALLPQVLVAVWQPSQGPLRVLGVVASSRLNRRGSCWQVEWLRLAPVHSRTDPSPRQLTAALVREAIQRGQGASSWLVHLEADEREQLAALREQGFQPQGTAGLWCWRPDLPPAARPAVGLSRDTGLLLRPLTSRTAPLLWHLEQILCPAPLRPLLDRRIEDLLDQSRGRGWLLIDPERQQAVAGIRWLADLSSGGQRVELSLDPAWPQLLGTPLLTLLHHQADDQPLGLRIPLGEGALAAALAAVGAELQAEELLLSRSVWQRRTPQPGLQAVRRLEAMLEPFQPGRQPVPTPLLRR